MHIEELHVPGTPEGKFIGCRQDARDFARSANLLDRLADLVDDGYIAPGKPIQIAFVESFKGRLRDECLNEHAFSTLAETRRIIEPWRIDDNTVRPIRASRAPHAPRTAARSGRRQT